MSSNRIERFDMPVPVVWQKVMLCLALGKAAVAGAGLGVALLGAFDVAAAVTARDWLSEIQHAYALDYAAAGGGLVGVVMRIIMR